MGLEGRNQLIPHASHGLDFDRTALHFLAQVRNVYIYRAGLAVKVEAPGLLQQLLAGKDAPRLLGQGEKQVKFLGAQVEGPISEAGFAAGRVNRQVTHRGRSIVRRNFSVPAQNGLHARHQFARIEWLGQVIIRAKFETKDFIDVLVTSG